MTDPSTPELDPQLEEWLAEARDAENGGPPPALDDLLASVEADLEKADRSPLFKLRAQATWVRRAVGLLAAGLIVAFGGALTLREDFADLPVAWIAVAVTSLAILLVTSVHAALRPLHQPPMPVWQRAGVVGLSLAATLALALLAPAGSVSTEGQGLLQHVSPCLFYGLLVGLPVYGVLRLLDRGRSTLALIAACAGGLTGNLALQLHCPRGGAEHLMLAHFAVVLLFIGGLGLVHWLVDRLRR